MSMGDAQAALRGWCADLEALRPFLDESDPTRAVFNNAWKIAFEKAKQAAKDYIEQAETVP